MARLFAVMTATYGQKFTSLLVNEEQEAAMKTVWWAMIKKFDLEAIKAALQKMPGEFVEWPPTAGQFAELCQSCVVQEYNPKLPAPRTESDEQLALESIEKMKEILGCKSK